MTDVVIAMHMANELLSVPVAGAGLVVAAAAVLLSAWRARTRLSADRLPLMGVMGAFVFAAQMINYPVLPGTSGHLGGGILLAILLGPASAILTMAAILIVQCLLFQDGGLLALGWNIVNMAVVPCLLGWLLYRVLLGPAERAKAWRQYAAAWVTCVAAVTAGAALVPVEAWLSGVLRIPLVHFLGVMVGAHLLIGLVEGAITFAVVAYVRRVRPSVLGLAPVGDAAAGPDRLGARAAIASIAAVAVLLAGVVCWFASAAPDGLEWTCQAGRYAGQDPVHENPSPTIGAVEAWQGRWAPMADYTKRAAPLGSDPVAEPEGPHVEAEAEAGWPNIDGWASLAGVVGTAVTLALVYVAAILVRRRREGAGRP